MRWRTEAGPKRLGNDEWGFTVVRGRRSRNIRAHVPAEAADLRGGSQESVAANLVNDHLNDHVPPDNVSLSTGWDYERKKPVAAEFGFTQLRGVRMRWMDVARRLHLPHWLQPRP